jgi:hypothetical protein
MPFKKIGKKIFSGKGYSGTKKVEMLEVKPSKRDTEEKRKRGKLIVEGSKTLNSIRRTNKDTLDKLEDMTEKTKIISKKIKGEEIGPSKMFDDIEKTMTDLETGEIEKYAKGGLVKKGLPRLAKRGWK